RRLASCVRGLIRLKHIALTPDFNSVGGSMVEVQENMARLLASDREAIAAYLKAVPAVDTE
ncbi:MAG: hypothetical protein WAU86_20010, partial [Oricola sp.]